MLIINLMLATQFKQVGTGAPKDWEKLGTCPRSSDQIAFHEWRSLMAAGDSIMTGEKRGILKRLSPSQAGDKERVPTLHRFLPG